MGLLCTIDLRLVRACNMNINFIIGELFEDVNYNDGLIPSLNFKTPDYTKRLEAYTLAL